MTVPAQAHWTDGHPDLFPPDPDLEPLHQREYVVRAWKVDEATILIRGGVMDLMPGRALAAADQVRWGVDVEQPLTVHHMIVDLHVAVPVMTITAAEVQFEANPQPACPSISASYRDLIGLSIARGFTHKVRELFGGPRGCTHTTALLQAMGPVAVQSLFAMGLARTRTAGAGSPGRDGSGPPAGTSFMKGTCHVWAEDGDLWQGVRVGRIPPVPLPMQRRLHEAGLDPAGFDLQGA